MTPLIRKLPLVAVLLFPFTPAAAQTPPMPLENPGNWVTSEDYPVDALRNDQEGVVRFKLVVGPDGVPVSCTIRESSGTATLDEVACILLQQRARFSPARDEKGQPTTGSFSNAVRWVIPNKPVWQFGPSEWVVTFIVHADASVSDCKVEKASADGPFSKLGPVACPIPVPVPYRDEAGKPVARKVIWRHQIEVVPIEP